MRRLLTRAWAQEKSHKKHKKATSRILDDRSYPQGALQLPGASGRASDEISQKKIKVL